MVIGRGCAAEISSMGGGGGKGVGCGGGIVAVVARNGEVVCLLLRLDCTPRTARLMDCISYSRQSVLRIGTICIVVGSSNIGRR